MNRIYDALKDLVIAAERFNGEFCRSPHGYDWVVMLGSDEAYCRAYAGWKFLKLLEEPNRGQRARAVLGKSTFEQVTKRIKESYLPQHWRVEALAAEVSTWSEAVDYALKVEEAVLQLGQEGILAKRQTYLTHQQYGLVVPWNSFAPTTTLAGDNRGSYLWESSHITGYDHDWMTHVGRLLGPQNLIVGWRVSDRDYNVSYLAKNEFGEFLPFVQAAQREFPHRRKLEDEEIYRLALLIAMDAKRDGWSLGEDEEVRRVLKPNTPCPCTGRKYVKVA